MSTILGGRVTMDLAAFARFCETSSIDYCTLEPANRHSYRLSVDADANNVMLETGVRDKTEPRNVGKLQLLPDLHKAAQAGQVDGAFMAACVDGGTRLEAVVFSNSNMWAGWGDCLNEPVNIGECAEYPDDDKTTKQQFRRVEGSATKLRVAWSNRMNWCDCSGEYDVRSDPICRNAGKSWSSNSAVADIAAFVPERAVGQAEQALFAALKTASADGRRGIGQLAWNADPSTTPEHYGMFRRWLETFPEKAGERYATWVYSIVASDWRAETGAAGSMFDYRPVVEEPDSTARGWCPGFLISDTPAPGSVRVPAHVDNRDLANAAKLVDANTPLNETIALLTAITHPDRS